MSDTTLDSVNALGTQTIVAGGEQTFIFNCVDANGSPLNITGATVTIKISPYGQSNVISISKTGTITNAVGGTWKVTFSSTDTINLYGVYQFQPKVVAFDGTIYFPAQGILNILANIM